MTLSAVRNCAALLALSLCAGLAASVHAQTPAHYSWQDPHAKVLPTGGLEWAPKPFVFEKGDSTRYIDFDAGSDARDGKTAQTAWKHHPWDASATGEAKAAKGVQTYVFKGGVAYRGVLKANESGEPGHPIRLTSDPAWGTGAGPASIYGSTQIRGGWKKATAADAPEIPSPEHVWFIDLGKDYDPDPDRAKFSAVFQVEGGKVDRLMIARQPNYDLADPNDPVKTWPTWDKYDPKTGTLTSSALKGLGDKNALNGATLWTESDFLMGAASNYAVPPGAYDQQAGSISGRDFGAHWFSRIPRAKVHFMIENVARFLDAPGEYFFAVNGPKAGRLFLWPARGIDPNRAVYEVAQTRIPIFIADQHDIMISGLEFRYNDPDDGGPHDNYVGNGSPAPCIRLLGNCTDITVRNCRFAYVAGAVTASLRADGDGGPSNDKTMDNIIVSDNDVQHSERAGTISIMGDSQKAPGASYGRLKHVEILRNRVFDTGFRPGYSPWSSIPAISVGMPETCEVAGNIVDTSYGNGIITYGGKDSGATNTVPLTRILVHHNQMDNTMLGCNDYGGLEHFQGGPAYLYDNVIHNCVGNRTLGGELGYSLYLDGGFKCYCFNNIIAGLVKEGQPDYYNNCGYFMVFGFLDQMFNNTLFHFTNALDGSSGNRSNILGNVMMDCKNSFIGQNRQGDVSMMYGGDTGEMGRMGIPTMAYGSNVFFGNPKEFGRIAGTGSIGASATKAPVLPGKTLEELRDKLQEEKCRVSSLGWQVSKAPLVDPVKHDYRLTADSGAKERGVTYFVPWALARTVGEWNFFKNPANPQVVLGENFYMTDEYLGREMYYFLPRNDLTVNVCTAQDYVAGPLEDWIEGALAFDGKTRVATLTHAEMTKNMEYPGKAGSKVAYDGAKRETLDMATNNFLIEIVFKTNPGQATGVLASKLAQAGYELAVGADGAAHLTLQASGGKATAVSTVKINDGKWHSLLAEVDRAAGKAAFYVDGKAAGESKLEGLSADAPLSNTADFVVGKGLAGAIDFLRVCRSTLAESKTSIEELYTWETAGPFLSDFTGKASAGGKRDAGAMEH